MYYCAVDLHSKSSVFWVVDSRGGKVLETRVPTSRISFTRALAPLKGRRARIVIEASNRTCWAAGVLQGLGLEVYVVDPRKVRVIAETKFKTDRTDARILADLLRTGALPPPVWMAPPEVRQLRDQVRVRSALVKARTQLILQARSRLAHLGLSLGARALSRASTWDRLQRSPEVPGYLKQLLQSLREAIEQLTNCIERAECEYAPSERSEQARRIQQIPGVGPVVAVTTLACLGDPRRFRDARAATAYAGIVPSERSSGERRRRGHITKQGPSELRRVWIQAAQAALLLKNHPLRDWVNKLIYRRGRSIAVVALARRMFRWAFALLRDQTDFRVDLTAQQA